MVGAALILVGGAYLSGYITTKRGLFPASALNRLQRLSPVFRASEAVKAGISWRDLYELRDDGVVIELHISNPGAREPWRNTSVVTPVAKGVISGFGGDGYRLAALALRELVP